MLRVYILKNNKGLKQKVKKVREEQEEKKKEEKKTEELGKRKSFEGQIRMRQFYK